MLSIFVGYIAYHYSCPAVRNYFLWINYKQGRLFRADYFSITGSWFSHRIMLTVPTLGCLHRHLHLILHLQLHLHRHHLVHWHHRHHRHHMHHRHHLILHRVFPCDLLISKIYLCILWRTPCWRRVGAGFCVFCYNHQARVYNSIYSLIFFFTFGRAFATFFAFKFILRPIIFFSLILEKKNFIIKGLLVAWNHFSFIFAGNSQRKLFLLCLLQRCNRYRDIRDPPRMGGGKATMKLMLGRWNKTSYTVTVVEGNKSLLTTRATALLRFYTRWRITSALHTSQYNIIPHS